MATSPVISFDNSLNGVPGVAVRRFLGFMIVPVLDGMTALAGGGQTGATQITGEIARVSTVATSGDSVMLPEARPGLDVMVINDGANPMQVYGNGSDAIDNQAAGTGVSQMQSSVVFYVCTQQGKWRSEGLATGFGGPGLQTISTIDGLTAAHTNAGQGVGPTFNRMYNRIATCANTNDSTNLPASFIGANIVVTNAGAQTCAVFPAIGDQINTGGANNAFSLTAGKTATFYCSTVGQWHALLSA